MNSVEGDYDPDRYHELVRSLENEPEGGARCAVCFDQRLTVAADYAVSHGFDSFTTTLTVSPYKNYKLISKIGEKRGEERGIEFEPFDFKKANT